MAVRTSPLVLLVIATIGGVVLNLNCWKQLSLPKEFELVHATIAVIGFLFFAGA